MLPIHIILPIHSITLHYIHLLRYQSIYYVTNQSITLPINQLCYQSTNYITNQSVMLPIGWLRNHQRVRQLLFVTYWLARNNFF